MSLSQLSNRNRTAMSTTSHLQASSLLRTSHDNILLHRQEFLNFIWPARRRLIHQLALHAPFRRTIPFFRHAGRESREEVVVLEITAQTFSLERRPDWSKICQLRTLLLGGTAGREGPGRGRADE